MHRMNNLDYKNTYIFIKWINFGFSVVQLTRLPLTGNQISANEARRHEMRLQLLSH